MFAVQHQGWCASAKYAYRTYGKYGRTNRCRNGKGGPWANDVYVLKGTKTAKLISINLGNFQDNLQLCKLLAMKLNDSEQFVYESKSQKHS